MYIIFRLESGSGPGTQELVGGLVVIVSWTYSKLFILLRPVLRWCWITSISLSEKWLSYRPWSGSKKIKSCWADSTTLHETRTYHILLVRLWEDISPVSSRIRKMWIRSLSQSWYQRQLLCWQIPRRKTIWKSGGEGRESRCRLSEYCRKITVTCIHPIRH